MLRIEKVPTKRQIERFYNDIAAAPYQARMYETQPHARDRLRRLLDLVPIGGRVLEVGCCDGYVSRDLAARADWLVGVDIAGACVERCHALGLDNAEFVQGTIEELAADLGEFDLVVASEVLEHQRKPDEFLRLLSTLAPRVIVTVPISENPNADTFSVEAFHNPRKAGDGSGHIWCPRPDTFRALFDEIEHYEDNGVSAIIVGRAG